MDYFEKSIIISSLKETNAYIEENINDDKKVRKAPSAGKTGRQDLKTITERDSRFSVNKNDTKKAWRGVIKSSPSATIKKDLKK